MEFIDMNKSTRRGIKIQIDNKYTIVIGILVIIFSVKGCIISISTTHRNPNKKEFLKQTLPLILNL